MAEQRAAKGEKTPEKKISPLFNSTGMVEIKLKCPAGVNPYKEKWDFLDEVMKVRKARGGI